MNPAEHNGMVTIGKSGRVYQRKFDHEDAIRRFQNGESAFVLAKEYGVSCTAVQRVVDPKRRALMTEHTRRWMMAGTCVDCGKKGIARKSSRCKPCSTKNSAQEVRADELWCNRCETWKKDEEFSSNISEKYRRYRHSSCSKCATEIRTAYRKRNMVPCEKCGAQTEGKGRPKRDNPDRPYLCLRCARGQTDSPLSQLYKTINADG